MPIAQSKYVPITSGIGGSSATSRKDLILRVFTTNALFPANTILEFGPGPDVANFAGSTSEESKIATAYFGWVSKQINSPAKISFMKYALNEATAPSIRSTIELASLETYQAITSGSIVINMGGLACSLTSLDFSSVTSYADVASVIQTALRAYTAGGTLYTSATVQYNATNSSFVLTGGATGANTITYATVAGTGTDISTTIGWSSTDNPLLSNGQNATTLTDTLNTSVELSDNFASYAFLGLTLDSDNVAEIGAWNTAQNYRFVFAGDVNDTNYEAVAAAAAGYEGICLNYNPYIGLSNYLPAWLMPVTALAATNYDNLNGTINYMYQQFPSQAVSVYTNELSSTLDNLFVNYNGQTQKAGTILNFYQDGYLSNGVDIAVYANEIWLKDAMITEILNLEVGMDKIPANIDGLGLIRAVLEDVISSAKFNGTISVGKPLTTTQKAYITQLTGDNTAWQTVELNGYILTLELKQNVVNGATKYSAAYTLIYSKGDVIRKVEGRHILI
mgnify:CR=1 FL=1